MIGHSDWIREQLGLAPKAKLPAAGMEPQIVGGFKVWVAPLGASYHGTRRAKHRVMVECSRCGRTFSYGRLGQHRSGRCGADECGNCGARASLGQSCECGGGGK
jgi:hypothetical protein